MEIYTSSALGLTKGITMYGGNNDGDAFNASSIAPISSNQKVSSLGKVMNAMSGLTANDREQAQAFREEIRSKIIEGEFDPKVMAQNAPDFMKQRAEQNDVSLTEVFQQLEVKVSKLMHFSSYGPGSVKGGNGVSDSQLFESLISFLTGDE